MSAAVSTPLDRHHPKGFWFIFWGELAERASFYGMASILVLYMTETLKFSDANAATVNHLFRAAAYILPLLGGYVADRWLGKFRTIVIFAAPYILGHIILGQFSTESGLILGLILLAGGSGAIKPNLSPLMGQMYEQQGKQHLMSQAFAWFYTAINIGAALTMLTLPNIRSHYGYSAAFMAPTVLMVISLAIFYAGKKYYPRETVGIVRVKTPAQREEQRAVLRRLAGVFLLIVFFWSIFDQSSSTWILFAKNYLNLDTIFGKIDPDAVQGLNPILIVVMSPLFAMYWARKDRKLGYKYPSTKKMQIGYWLVVLCMGVMAVAGYISTGYDTAGKLVSINKITVLWEVGAYLLITMAELCLSIVGLEFAYTQAPQHMKSFLTGCFLFTVFLGNSLAAWLSRIYTEMHPGNYFLLMTVMMTVVAIVFIFVSRRFERTA